ncbi:MAG: hypothetical protein ABL977_11295 [Candidatus Eisenbacteria bacterium]
MSFDLRGETYMELRDPLGRWITFSRDSNAYRSEIPNSSAERNLLEYFEHSDEDAEEAESDSSEATYKNNPQFNRDGITIRGPLNGDYVIRVWHRPGADCDIDVGVQRPDALTSEFLSIAIPPDSVSLHRLHFEFGDSTPIRVEPLASVALVPVLEQRPPLRLPCEPDSFDTMPGPDAAIELRAPGVATLTLTVLDGTNYSAATREMWIRRRSPTWPSHATLRLEGRPRGIYQIGVQAESTAIHVVTVSKRLPDGELFTRSDSALIHQGDSHYWHLSVSERRKRNSRWIDLVHGPVAYPAHVDVASSVLAVGTEPALSADGRSLAYVRGRSLWKLELATGVRTHLGDFRDPHWPSWSPDGRSLLFHAGGVSGDSTSPRIWRINADGSGARVFLKPGALPDRYPIWSKRGDRIVWTRASRLWIADSSGANAHPLTRHPARVFERASEWQADGTLLYVASDGACDGPQYELRRIRANGTPVTSDGPGVRAQDARTVAGGRVACWTNGRRLFVSEINSNAEPTMLVPGYETVGFHRSRIALAPDGRSGVTDGDPFPYGDPVLVSFEVPAPERPDLLRRWRDALNMLGADSTRIVTLWGSPTERLQSTSGNRVWSYSLAKRGERSDGWLQFHFSQNGKLWSVTRGPDPSPRFRGRF